MTSPQTILIIDDDRDVAKGAGIRLQLAGYRVLLAHDGSLLAPLEAINSLLMELQS